MRVPRRWITPFASDMRRYGVIPICRDLRARGEPVTPKAVYNWIRGDRTPPLRRALVIVDLVRERFGSEAQLTHVNQILGHALEVRTER